MTTSNTEMLRTLYEQDKIPAQDLEFVKSLLAADLTRGLSLKQAKWVGKLVERFTTPAPAPVAVGSMAGVVALLARARHSGLKFPKLWLQLPDGSPLRISVAGPKSRTPGYLMLTDGESFGANRFYGKIAPTGALEFGRDRAPGLVELLTRLGTDPAAVAAEFGHLTGHCCFCSLALKDDRSVSVGYGPVCAEKFGLAWGVKAAKVAQSAAAAQSI